MLAAETDERLVVLAAAGDERAFAAIVERYRAPLHRYVGGFLPPAAADDALQQAFINAYAALTSERARAPESLRPWLFRVARNAALNVARDPQASYAPLPDGLDGVERPDEALQRSERLRAVVGAVRALPARQRDVIVRHALDGDSHEQIAADLGMSPGAIRQLAHRARRTVREAAAALIPVPVLRWLGWGLAESAPALGGGGAASRVAAAAIATAVAGGGAVEVATVDRARERPRAAVAAAPPPPPKRAAAAAKPAVAVTQVARPRSAPVAVARPERDRSGPGSEGSGTSDSSGSGSSGSGSSGITTTPPSSTIGGTPGPSSAGTATSCTMGAKAGTPAPLRIKSM